MKSSLNKPHSYMIICRFNFKVYNSLTILAHLHALRTYSYIVHTFVCTYVHAIMGYFSTPSCLLPPPMCMAVMKLANLLEK